ncbi:MAG: epimerase [Chitinophagales bacterium]|nr:epimerase [Chitinophagales bacterium]
MKLRVIITGTTGMVGEGVLLEALSNPAVEQVLVINRKPLGRTHPKLKEIIHPNFYDITPIQEQLKGYNACFFCLGTSSMSMNETDYTKVTYTLTLHVANVLLKQNPGMTFIYVSGAGTDSTEKGRTMWARVKGKTENDLLALGFKDAYAFRPGLMQATEGQRNLLPAYKYLAWLAPTLVRFFPSFASTLAQVGQAMIVAATKGSPKKVLEVKDIIALSKG